MADTKIGTGLPLVRELERIELLRGHAAALGDWPSDPTTGQIAVNTDIGWVGQWNGTAWILLWPVGSSPDHIFRIVVDDDHTIDLTANGDGANFIDVDTSGGDVEITLPPIADAGHSRVVVQKLAEANKVTISAQGSTPLFPFAPSNAIELHKALDRVHLFGAPVSAGFPNGAWYVEFDGTRSMQLVESGNPAFILPQTVLALVDLHGGSGDTVLQLPDPSAVENFMVPPRHSVLVKVIDDDGGSWTVSVKPHSGGTVEGGAVDAAYAMPAVAGTKPSRTFTYYGGGAWYVTAGLG